MDVFVHPTVPTCKFELVIGDEEREHGVDRLAFTLEARDVVDQRSHGECDASRQFLDQFRRSICLLEFALHRSDQLRSQRLLTTIK